MAENLAREMLRAATADCHRRVDEIYSAARLSDPVSYGNFLCAQAAAFLPVEAALDAAGISDVIDDWPSRMRAPHLMHDLSELGIARPAPVAPFAIAGAAEMLGALYVIEGSRLGAKLLKRSVPAHLPATFLGGSGSGSWQSLLILLDRMLDTVELRHQAIGAASDVFTLFERCGRHYLPYSHGGLRPLKPVAA